MTKKLIVSMTATIAIGLIYTGCASTAENMRAKGYGPNYSQGYGDGCSSGKKAGGSMLDQFKKDVRQYDSNYKYKEGWEDGYRECRSEEKQLMKSIDDSMRDQAIRDSRR